MGDRGDAVCWFDMILCWMCSRVAGRTGLWAAGREGCQRAGRHLWVVGTHGCCGGGRIQGLGDVLDGVGELWADKRVPQQEEIQWCTRGAGEGQEGDAGEALDGAALRLAADD